MPSFDKSKNTKSIKGARSLNELLSIIDLIEGNIKDLDRRTDKILSSLGNVANSITISISASRELESTQLGTDLKKQITSIEREVADLKGKAPKGQFPKILDKNFKSPNTKDLVKNSVAIQELNENISELEISLRVLQSKAFSKLDENSVATVHIKTVLKKAKELREKQLKAMSRVGKSYTPKEHTKIITLARKVLLDELNEDSYSRIAAKTFILNPRPDVLYFQTFLVVNDLTNSDGYVYEAYSYIVTSVFQTKDGALAHHLTTLKDPKTPGTFPIGKEVDSASSLKMKIRMLNNLDNLFFKKNKAFIKKTNAQVQQSFVEKNSQGKRVSRISPHIKGMRVKDNNLYVSISPSLTETKKKQMINDLFPIVRQFLLPNRGKSTSLGMKEIVGKRSGKPLLVFTLGRNEDTRTKEFVNKMSNLVEALELNPQIQRSVLQKIVEEYEP